ncbi:uncharacterized protein LOC109721541 isoform X1 [Ananas comosus]|uniref:Uncharacterized protein LOC109721541 isoform X1 n=2 Tax=Ananas comosus TaxID=4615 RepID=A0A6P5GAE2_ANACO|nr:uncharacterized protein LOC109721541 isoform X1 [Ananas comosus]XP_020104788.1 uncharacterized protein LOC109721541 isoform X1 [Ananas comosus]
MAEEKPAERRLQAISRHLLLPSQLHTQELYLEPKSVISPSPVIIGGMVLDIHAKPYAYPNPGTTTPGKVRYFNGGVARNVAECMSKLGSKPFMISVVGDDVAGDLLMRYWKTARLPTEGIQQLPGIITPAASLIFDCNGELAAAVVSVEAVETFLTPDWIKQFQPNIFAAPVVMVDANLPPHSLEVACQIAARCAIPLWFEPVSVAKSTRIASIVNHVTFASPNEIELIAMANALSPKKGFNFVPAEATKGIGQPVDYLFEQLKPSIQFLLQKGIKMLIVTLGSNGVFFCCGELSFTKSNLNLSTSSFNGIYELMKETCLPKQCVSYVESAQRSIKSFAFHFPALPASVVSLTGAGDCLVGGILASICSGLNVMQSVAVGIAVAKAAVEAETNVPAEFSLSNVADEAKKIISAVKPLLLE